ncbi:MAG: nucleotidyltransferase family protein [Blastocatellia bacterium]|nr:nucleotidyltransferase family protein [Blastocatellia bacterium]
MLPEAIRAKQEPLKEVCRRYRIRELSLFGSMARGDFNDQSDVDLLVEFEPEMEVGFLTLSRLHRELSSILGRPIDLVPKLGLKPAIKQEVLESAELVYAA